MAGAAIGGGDNDDEDDDDDDGNDDVDDDDEDEGEDEGDEEIDPEEKLPPRFFPRAASLSQPTDSSCDENGVAGGGPELSDGLGLRSGVSSGVGCELGGECAAVGLRDELMHLRPMRRRKRRSGQTKA